MNHPLRAYGFGNKRASTNSVASSQYDSVPVDLGSLDGGSQPRHFPSAPYARSDEVPFFSNEVPNTQPPRRRQTHDAHLAFFRWWVPEIFASILSICAILAIAIVLRVYDGRGLDDLHLPAGFTLNGLIAAIATFDRVFLIVPVGSAISQEAWLWFAHNGGKANPKSRLRDLNLSDSASRGAWGAFIFIFYTPWRWLTLLGCIISILSLAIGTFTQQLISIENMPVRNNSSRLQPGNIQRAEVYENLTGNPAEAAWGPLLNMKAAIYNGFMSENVQPLDVTCETGNCTFPETTSLSICGGCAPLSYTQRHCNTTACNYTSPTGGTFEMANWNNTDEGVGFVSQASYGHTYPVAAGDRMYITNFETLGAQYGCVSGCVEEQTHPNFTAHECALWFCVSTYNTSVANGQQSQRIVSTYDVPNASKVDIADGGANANLLNITYLGHNYTLYWLAWEALAHNLYDIINGTSFLNLESYGPSSDIVEAIWSGMETPDAWIERVALSMSNVVRTSALQPQPRFNGVAYTLGIKVKWWWLTLPIATVAASILLLIIVMIRTSRSTISAWKGSPLTFLLFEVDHDIRRAVNDAGWTGIASGIEKSVGKRKVTLHKKECHQGGAGGWAFRDLGREVYAVR